MTQRFHTLGTSPEHGASFIDVIVGSMLFVLIFAGFFAVMQFGVRVGTDSKARAGAIALAQEQLEYVHTIAYADVGTAWADHDRGHGNDEDNYDEDNPGHGGGGIGDNYEFVSAIRETIVLNGITYTRRTLVVTKDDAADGTGGHDQNHVQEDYKQVKVSVSWTLRSIEHSVTFETIVVPDGLEH